MKKVHYFTAVLCVAMLFPIGGSRTVFAKKPDATLATISSAEYSNDGYGVITMTTVMKGEAVIALAGTGEVGINWGDGSAPEKVTLSAPEFNEYGQFIDSNRYAHTFPYATERIIIIVGQNVTHLDCGNLPLTAIDVSDNTALTYLDCTGNYFSLDNFIPGRLSTLDVSKNTALTYLNCSANDLTSLDVSKNTALEDLTCSGNDLTSLDVSNNTGLKDLTCSGNDLTSLDMPKNIALIYLECSGNRLTNLDMSNNIVLTFLDCSRNQLTSLDVSKNTALTYLNCPMNRLASLDVSKNTALTFLDCSRNQLTSLDVSKNIALTELNCENNHRLTGLDVSKNTALENLNYNEKQLTTKTPDAAVNIMITMTTATKGEAFFRMAGTGTVAIDWGDGSAPQTITLSVYSDDVHFYYADPYWYSHTFRDTTSRTITIDGQNITHLYCHTLKLTDLDVTKNTTLKWLGCENNLLTSLNVSNCTALTDLNCAMNRLTSLDVGNCTALTDLDCGSNRLTILDVSKNTVLESFGCGFNRFTAEALNTLFGTLHGNSGNKEIYIDNNPGTAGCNRSIATVKSWTVKN